MATKQVNIDIIARDKSQQALKSVRGNLDNVKNTANKVRNALVAIGGALVVRSILNTTAEFEDLRDSLQSVTGSVEKGAEAFKFISDFATRSQFSVQELTRTFITLKASGIEPTEKLLRTFTDTAAVTTDQLGVLEALTRVFSRGVQGGLGLEELNQIADRGIPVFRILEERIGLTRLEISKFGQTTEGAITILKALEEGLGETFAGATEQKLDNLSVAFSNFGIALDNIKDAFGQEVSPEVTRFVNNLGKVLDFISPLISGLGKLTNFLLSGVNTAFEFLGSSVEFVTTKFTELLRFIGVLDAETKKAVEQITNLDNALGNVGKSIEDIPKMPVFDIVPQAEAKLAKNEAVFQQIKKRSLDELELIKLRMKEELALVKDSQTQLQLIRDQAIATGIMSEDMANSIYEQKMKDLEKIKTELIKQGAKERLEIVNNELQQIKDKMASNYNEQFQIIKQGKFQELDLEKLTKDQKVQLTKDAGRELISQLAQNNKAMFVIDKALRIRQAYMNTAAGVTRALASGNIPLAAIIGGLGAVQIATIMRQQYQGRAGGGSVNKGQAYMVGEKGPEMFVPSGSGKIVPNNQMGNSQPVNVNFNINTVDARGFNELLVNSRGLIVNMINSAVNEKGKQAIV